MTRAEAEAEALRRARQICEERRETQEAFLREEFDDLVRHACADLETPELDGLSAWAATVDREYLEKWDNKTGQADGMDGNMDLGDGWRIAACYARGAHTKRELRSVAAYRAQARADYQEALKRYRRTSEEGGE
jgi:hypothetical protein